MESQISVENSTDDSSVENMSDSITKNPKLSQVDSTELDILITKLLVHTPSHKRRKWSYNKIDLENILKSCSEIEEKFTKNEIMLCIGAFTDQRKEFTSWRYSHSWNKKKLATALNHIYTGEVPAGVVLPRNRTAQTLRKLCQKVIGTFSKGTLDVIYATHIYSSCLQEWQQSSTIKNTVKITGTNDPEYWYSHPGFNKTVDRILFTVFDSHHILTDARCKVCSTGIPKAGVSKEAWVEVAKDNNTALNRAMVEDLIDRQSDFFACKTFSLEVETAMLEKGYTNEAEFCHLIREWYRAEDEAGIDAMERFQMRFAFS
jgi:hypothetical protein